MNWKQDLKKLKMFHNKISSEDYIISINDHVAPDNVISSNIHTQYPVEPEPLEPEPPEPEPPEPEPPELHKIDLLEFFKRVFSG